MHGAYKVKLWREKLRWTRYLQLLTTAFLSKMHTESNPTLALISANVVMHHLLSQYNTSGGISCNMNTLTKEGLNYMSFPYYVTYK